MHSINCLVWELGIEFERALTNGGHFNVKKKIYPKVTLNVTVNIEF